MIAAPGPAKASLAAPGILAYCIRRFLIPGPARRLEGGWARVCELKRERDGSHTGKRRTMASRRKILAGAWKAYLVNDAAVDLARKVAAAVGASDRGFDLAVCPSAPSLVPVKEALGTANVAVGAQDVFWEPDVGAYTGQVTAEQLRAIGCAYVIVGHSEMRELDGETDEKVNGRARAALVHDIEPIVCVGESADERAANRARQRVGDQITAALAGMEQGERARTMLAYEPIWAITSARNPNARAATLEQIVEMHQAIRSLLASEYGADVAARMRILYGGSVKPANAEEFAAQDDVDGLLVGSASVRFDSFAAIIDAVGRVSV